MLGEYILRDDYFERRIARLSGLRRGDSQVRHTTLCSEEWKDAFTQHPHRLQVRAGRTPELLWDFLTPPSDCQLGCHATSIAKHEDTNMNETDKHS